jgi:FkbM family methyltransferase
MRGHRFHTQGFRGSMAIAAGRYEPTVSRFLNAELAGARVFFDIGANTGYFTRLALTVMPDDAIVVAFEPDKSWHSALMALDPRRVTVRTEAVGRADGTAALVSPRQGCSRLEDAVPARSPVAARSTTVVRSLDTLLRDGSVPVPDVLKVDVEGSELDVLEGAEHVLQNVRALAVECHSMPLFRDVLDRCLAAGFDEIRSTGGGDGVGPPTVFARRST